MAFTVGWCLLGAHGTRHLLEPIVRRTGYATAAGSLNMVHQSAVVIVCLSWYCLWILVKADKLISPLVPIGSGHEPPAVLQGPSWWTLVCPWHHNVFGASAHLTHSTGDVVFME